MKVNSYLAFELVVHQHVFIDFAQEGWPPVNAPSAEAPPHGSHPSRTLVVRLRDNGGSEKPSTEEMRTRTAGMWGSKIVERGTDRVWLVSSGPGWQTEPYKGDWPPPVEFVDSPPYSDEFTLHVLPWRNDCDHVLHECQDGCGAKLVVWRDSAGVEHRKHEGFETPAHEDDLWRKTGDEYLHEWCRTGWRQSCDARRRWQESRGKPEDAERLAEHKQAEAEFERRSKEST